MLKRWASWPPSVRWLAGIAAAVLALAIVWALFVPVPDWLAHHDIGSAKGPLLQSARDAARGRLLTLGAGLLAAGALLYTARNFTLGRRTFELTEQGQVTDRYTKAIEQLGSDKLDVRIGGIYALERVARDSPRDHPTVMEVLNAFIREHSREQWPKPERKTDPAPPRRTRPDVHAALTVIRRRDARRDIRPIDLTGANLTGANLTGANLGGAVLTDANLTDAKLTRANFTDANLIGADLVRADLVRADLTGATLAVADLRGATLVRAHLDRATLDSADLTDADLGGAILDNADLTGADLGGAVLRGADLTGANLSGTRWPQDVPVPQGWRMDADSAGRLTAAGTDSGPAEAD